jgi:hydroxymethylpyrimidine pyrophosphatase-like HAD family hydrolase
MVSLMGDDALLDGLRERAGASLGGRARMQSIANRNYRGDILEFVSPASSKWAALHWVAAGAGIGPEAIAAVGDDANDLEMIARAGLGIAMGNAIGAVLDAADGIVGANDEGGVIDAIERVLRET